jgi:hypothetical protein
VAGLSGFVAAVRPPICPSIHRPNPTLPATTAAATLLFRASFFPSFLPVPSVLPFFLFDSRCPMFGAAAATVITHTRYHYYRAAANELGLS